MSCVSVSIASSLVTECNQWINLHGTACRNVTSEHRDYQHRQRNSNVSKRVSRRDSIKFTCQQTSDHKRADQAQCDSHYRKLATLFENKPENVTPLSA